MPKPVPGPGRTDLERQILRFGHLTEVPSWVLRFDPALDLSVGISLPGVHRPFEPGRLGDLVLLTTLEVYRQKIASARRILDVGCGPGWPCLALDGGHQAFVGLDPSAKMVELASEAAKTRGLKAEFTLAAAEEIPFESGDFDAAVLEGVLEVTRKPEKAVGEIYRVLRPGGVAVVMVANWLNVTAGRGVIEEVYFTRREGHICLISVILESEPPSETEYQCRLSPDSELYGRLAGMNLEDLESLNPLDLIRFPDLILSVASGEAIRWFKSDQFTPPLLERLFRTAGFDQVVVRGWGNPAYRWWADHPGASLGLMEMSRVSRELAARVDEIDPSRFHTHLFGFARKG